MAESSIIGVGWAGTILSIMLYASQLPLMRRLLREGDASLPGYSYFRSSGSSRKQVHGAVMHYVCNLLSPCWWRISWVGFAWVYLLLFGYCTRNMARPFQDHDLWIACMWCDRRFLRAVRITQGVRCFIPENSITGLLSHV